MFYTLTNRDGQTTLSVFGETFEKVLPSTHPNFAATVEYLSNNTEHDEEFVRGLVDPAVGIGRILQEHFGERLTFDLHNLYLDGLPISGSLASVVKQRLMANDQDWVRFARFLVNLDSNPSKRAKDATWAWVEGQGLTITEDGCFLGYKAVAYDGKSINSGPDNYINGVYYGKPGEHYHVPHEIGTVVSKKRADVDDTPGGGCSVGLHVGSKEYATNFGPRLLTVKVNPADVVSAPDEGTLNWKIRVCRYEVVDLAKPEHFASTSADPVTEEHVKSEERVAKEVTLAGLSTEERWDYETYRKAGHSHEEALEAIRENEDGDWYSRTAEDLRAAHAEAQATGQPVMVASQDVEETNPGPEEFEDVTDEDVTDEDEPTVEPEEGKTLADYAEVIPALKADLYDAHQGHKPVARKWSDYTTEASVRRYRKANGVTLTLATKVKDAVS